MICVYNGFYFIFSLFLVNYAVSIDKNAWENKMNFSSIFSKFYFSDLLFD